MIVRFGYVAMSTFVQNASPSKTMTVTQFKKLLYREAAIRKLERLALENLHNTLRILRHNHAYHIQVYRFSSKLIPLFGHPAVADWDPYPALAESFAAIGDYVRKHEMRVSFHPDHFTVLSTPRTDVLNSSVADLGRHVHTLNVMGLDKRAKCNIHIGGTYGNKPSAMERFVNHFSELEPIVQERITLENDDKTFTAAETLSISEKLHTPMVLDIHHHQINHAGESVVDLWPRICQTWSSTDLPPKIHASSPKNEKDPRAHADYVDVHVMLAFLRSVADITPKLDVMLEAKMKDGAVFKLMEELQGQEGVTILNEASIEIKC